MVKQLDSNISYFSVVQNGLTAVLLKANESSEFPKHYVEHQQFVNEWIAKNKAVKIPYQHLKREATRRKAILVAQALANREERDRVGTSVSPDNRT